MTRIRPISPIGGAPRPRPALRVGCVSFLNAKPLIVGLDEIGDAHVPPPEVRYDVPSRLLADLEAGEVDIALSPVIDFQRSRVPLRIVPVGGIGCQGTTLTVRLYSRVPLEQIESIHADTDSHTSVALMQVLLSKLHNRRPRLVAFDAHQQLVEDDSPDWPQAMLLIGDKVVTASPPAVRYPHQLDLGYAWRALTGLPFVFAVWMTREGVDLGALPRQLATVRERNTLRIDRLVEQFAAPMGWPRDLAHEYLAKWLCFEIGRPQLEAIELFHHHAASLGLIEHARPQRLYPLSSETS